MTQKYKFTFYACCVSSVLMAAIVNVTPIIFIPLKEIYNLTYASLGILCSVNFVTQFVCDFLFGYLADKFGVKRFLILAASLALIGFILFSASPALFPQNTFSGLLVATFLFSIGGGIMETLLSPVVNALPAENKAATMSIMHSFYAWGQVAVVLITTFLIKVFGRQNWFVTYLFWSILAFSSLIMLSLSTILPPERSENNNGIKSFIFKPMFLLSLLIMLGGGATEIGLSQWASSFMEKGLAIPKETGDILGMCMFAVFMGLGRTLYAKVGGKLRVINVLITGASLALICYIAVAVSPYPVFSLIFCAICGIAVSLLWPCTLTMCAEHFPYGGTLMFAILAGGGDAGCSSAPWLIGAVVDLAAKWPFCADFAAKLSLTAEQLALRIGILSGGIFPFMALVGLLVFKFKSKKKREQELKNL
ncbi:MAG: MFS transporter [Clostridia bacterium]|nr:MFS transporter [Clostridia bacterium]